MDVMDNSPSHPDTFEHIMQQSLSQPLLLKGRTPSTRCSDLQLPPGFAQSCFDAFRRAVRSHPLISHGFRPSSSAGDFSHDAARAKLGEKPPAPAPSSRDLSGFFRFYF